MNRADQRGYLTFDDVLEVLDEDGDDITTLETVLYELDELGIEIRQESEASSRLGTVEDHEFAREALAREVSEEAGIEVNPADLQLVHVMHRHKLKKNEVSLVLYSLNACWLYLMLAEASTPLGLRSVIDKVVPIELPG